jgi:hypothetical protein
MNHSVYRLLVFRELVEGKPGGIAPNLGNRLNHVFQVEPKIPGHR